MMQASLLKQGPSDSQILDCITYSLQYAVFCLTCQTIWIKASTKQINAYVIQLNTVYCMTSQ